MSHQVERVTEQVQRVYHHRICTDEANVNGLSLRDQNWLRIREALAVHDMPAAGHRRYELSVRSVGPGRLLMLRNS